MKRNLVLIRHTKSDWGDFSVADIDRPIRKDRIDDAKEMAAQLKSLKIEPDLIICSPAKRTRQTARYFCDKLKYKEDKIKFDKRIYESSAGEILQAVHETPKAIKTLLVIGHNPSLTNLVNRLVKNEINEMPTTGVAWIELSSDDWEISSRTACILKGLYGPKTIK